MLWTKQYYYFDLDRWLKEHQAHPLTGSGGRAVRNAEWFHMLNGDVISMPDKWEYPWYRRLGPGLPHHLALAGGLRLRQGAAAADAAQPLRPPQRPDPGLRVELQRREPAGARLGPRLFLYKYEKNLAGRTSSSWRARSRACSSTSTGGSTARTRRAGTSSPAASWASTTSGSSTRSARCPPAGRSSRPTARPGWPSTARTCWRSP